MSLFFLMAGRKGCLVEYGGNFYPLKRLVSKYFSLMDNYSKLKTSFFIILLIACVWITESLVHLALVSEDTFWEAVFLNVSGHELYMRTIIIIAICMSYLLYIQKKIIQDKESQISNILRNVFPVCITNKNFEIVMANESYWKIWGKPENENLKCYDHRPGEDCHTENCALAKIVNGEKEYTCESTKTYENNKHHFILTARPFLDSKNRIAGIIESFQDITARKKLEDEKEALIHQLKSSLEKVKL